MSEEGSNSSDDITTANTVWDVKSRIQLLDAIGHCLPIGVNKNFSLININILLKQQLPEKSFTLDQILKEIDEFYNLDLLDDYIIGEDEVNFELPEEYKSLMDDRNVVTKKQRN